MKRRLMWAMHIKTRSIDQEARPALSIRDRPISRREGSIKSVIDCHYLLEKRVDAFELLSQKRARNKVISDLN